MQRESFQGVADSDLINARLNGAARRSRAIANGPENLQSDDVVDLRPATDTADAAAETIAQLRILRLLLRVSLHDQLAPANT